VNLKQLEALVWTARLLSFSAAAEKLNATQPGISNSIRKLEEELGVTLFDRTRQFVRLTPNGRRCVELAEQIIGIAEDLRIQVGSQDRITGTVRVGVGESIAMSWLSRLLGRLDQRYPGLAVHLEIGLTVPMIRRLEEQDADVVIVGGGTTYLPAKGCAVSYVGSLQFSWLAAPGVYVGPQPADPRAIAELRVLTFSPGAMMQDVIDEWFSRDSVRPTRHISCDSMTLLGTLARARLGVSLLPRELFADDLAAGSLEEVATTAPLDPVHYFAMYTRSRWSSLGQIVAEEAVDVSTYRRVLQT